MEDAGAAPEPGAWDFFVSYTAVDGRWAEWIAWQLEEAGYRVLIQLWDFVPGSNWQFRMQEGIRFARRTIAVLSHAYLASVYGQVEWQAAYDADPRGFTRRLVPIRLEDCPRPGLLSGVVSIDLFGRPPDEARQRLLDQIRHAVDGRAKPPAPPAFPIHEPPAPVVAARERPDGVPRDAPGDLAPAGHRAKPAAPPAYPAFPAPPAPAETPWSPGPSTRSPEPSVSPASSGLLAFPAPTAPRASEDPVPGSAGPVGPVVPGARRPPARWSDIADPRLVAELSTGHENAVRVTFAPDGRTLATSWAAALPGQSSGVQLWDVGDPADPVPLGAPMEGRNAIFASDRRTMATRSFRGVDVWDLANDRARPARLAVIRSAGVQSAAFAADGRVLATGHRDARVCLWDLHARDRPVSMGEFSSRDGGNWTVVAFAPGGHLLATHGTGSRIVRLWDVSDPARPARAGSVPVVGYLGDRGLGPTFDFWRPTQERFFYVSTLCFSPSGGLLAFTVAAGLNRQPRDSSVALWDVSDPARPVQVCKRVQAFRRAGDTDLDASSVAFAPDGRTLAAGGRAMPGATFDQVRLWDLSDPGNPHEDVEPMNGPVTRTASAAVSVAFAPAGHTVAAGSWDGVVRLWRAR
ncbi:TIR domain-containing protein [Pseudofrankia sp. BMG5.36]|uniref:toll/interleukin-1 receptor domain-containing protein n=1 Tax=Pseudofrankia sp. BMG5.36 TaxID=1834512 RepID=UPI0008DABC42|nr:TIR domain-containing protein [Pseudofrankia sp. BMG5.36]OHV69813.1 hypothetical protein BCD48_34655 [Pseudofrankia sp. BMG5.36]